MIKIIMGKLENGNLEITEKMLNDILSYMKKQEKEMEILQNDLDNANSKLKDYLGRNIRAINLIENMLLRFDTFSALEVKTIKYVLEGQGADDNERNKNKAKKHKRTRRNNRNS